MIPFPIEEIAAAGALFAVVVGALLQALKKLGLPGGVVAGWMAFCSGPVLALIWWWSTAEALTFKGSVVPILTGLVGSFIAMGVYRVLPRPSKEEVVHEDRSVDRSLGS